MQLLTEIEKSQEKILIIDNYGDGDGLTLLKETLQKYDYDVFVTPKIPQKNSHFFAYIFINVTDKVLDKLIYSPHNKYVFIFINKTKFAHSLHKLVTNHKLPVKVIDIVSHDGYQEREIEQIVWFTFSETTESLLTLRPAYMKKQVK
ncbi:hypothetical protein HGB07_09215, partial [Candidatus Roizmanbacteria bacterium]|nr:hypothetical protein [Candidatus Roizmanbacteria bacterium]